MDSVFIADPCVLKHQEYYYLYGTTSSNEGFACWKSKNLVDWQPEGWAFRRGTDTWGESSFWAPEVIYHKNKFYMIYSSRGTTRFGKGLRLCLAVSDSPTGPFSDVYAPLFDLGFSCIDGHLFTDEDGKVYLYYEMVGSVGEFWNQSGYLWGYVFGVELSEDLSKLKHEPVLCLYPTQEWEGVTSMRARSNEGMTVFRHNNLYYMTYSGNHYLDPNYGVGFATSQKPLGMWKKSADNPILKKDISIGVSGPGHNCIVKSPNDKEWLIIYHTHADSEHPTNRRVINIDRLIFTEDSKLRVDGPTRTPQPYPFGSQ